MLEKLTIKDFQCHKRLEIIFDKEVTVLTGSSDVGKSSVLRALAWVCTNRGGGESVIRFGSGSVRVSLWVDGRKVTRGRERKLRDNYYRLDGDVFRAFGVSGTPQVLAQLLNVSDTLNFQGQLSPHFWFSLTPGQVAKELNQIINLDVIDRVLAQAASELRKSKAVVEVGEERLKQAREKRDNLSWIRECDRDYQALEAAELELQEKRTRIDSAEAVLQEAQTLARARSDAAEAKIDALEAASLAEKALQAGERVAKVEQLIHDHDDKESELCQLRKQISSVSAKLAKVKKCPLCQTPLKSLPSSVPIST